MDDQNANDQSLSGSDAPQPPMPPTQPVQPSAPSAPQFSPAAYGQPTAPYGQPQAPGVQPSSYYQPTPSQSNGKAVGALACGILAILFSWMPLFGVVLGMVAIVLAVQAAKQTGKDGKATGGKVCGIVGIVLSVLAFFAWMALSMGVALYIAAESSDTHSGSSQVAPLASSSATEDERRMEAAVAAQLDKLKAKDAVTMQQLADEAYERLRVMDYSLTDLGIDPAVFVDWMLTDVDYEIDGAYDNGDGTGTAYANLTLHDSASFAMTFMKDVQAAADAGELDGVDEAAAQALLGELYRAAMDKSTAMTTSYVGLDLVKTGNAWQVDEDSWSDELSYLFGL